MPSSTSNSEPMKKTILTILLTLALAALIPVTLVCWGFLTPPVYDDTYLGELKYKVRLLDETPGPRIILVGGSALAFGVDSALIEEQLPDYHVVNFGMYAALGTTVMLDLARESLRPGDLVILVPEQQTQTLSDFFDPERMWQALDGEFSLLTRLSSRYWEQLVAAFPAFAGGKMGYHLKQSLPQTEGVYSRASFNAWGDLENARCHGNVMVSGLDPNTPIRFDEEMVTPEFLTAVQEFAAYGESLGARVCYGLCPMNAAAVEGHGDAAGFYDALAQKLDIPILGDPEQFILESGWFYDTNFHLNTSGKVVYTRQLIRGIKAILGDASPTEIPLPTMPDPVGLPVTPGDDRDGACFQYRQTGDSWEILSVTPAGQEKTRLVVPGTWQGLPVTAIGADAFRDCPVVEQIVIPENIRVVEDGAFRGCEALTQILLRQQSPSACSVGQGLLDGTSARVLVPAGCLSAYRTDYFWSLHSGRLEEQEG